MVALERRRWCILFSRIFHERGGPCRRKPEGAPELREIITAEEPPSTPRDPATSAVAAFGDDFVEPRLASDEAVCLAANQIGETKRIVAYLNEAGRPQVMYNPRVTQKLIPYSAVEACLSRVEPTAVSRYVWVRVSYEVLVDGELVERKKKLEGNAAQAVQHMIDHCEGILV